MSDLPLGSKGFIRGLPFIAIASDLEARWGCGKPGERFRCAFCGHKFAVGDVVRCQYSNDTPGAGGNPFVCAKCDDGREKNLEKWKAMHEEYRTRFWWFNDR